MDTFQLNKPVKRFEYKYVVEKEKLAQLLKHLTPYIIEDPFTKKRMNHSYTVHSLYYDTRRLDFYHQKIQGLKNRKKLRIRGYDQPAANSHCYLEVKEKTGLIIQKTRSAVKFSHLRDLLQYSYLDNPQTFEKARSVGNEHKRFFYYMHKLDLLPVLNVHYNRRAFYYKLNGDLRFTLDSDIGAAHSINPEHLYSGENIVPAFSPSILEIKTAVGIPNWVQQIILAMGLRLQSLSKYCLCLEAIARRDNKLNRLLKGGEKSYNYLCKRLHPVEKNYA